MQLVAYGAQDIYLSGNPEITYFKSIYKRHTNFAVESIEQYFNVTPDFGKKASVTVSRNGDLITNTYLRIDLPSIKTDDINGFSWTEEIGHFLIKSVEIEIGGEIIDKHYGVWLSIWNSLTLNRSGHQEGYNIMIGNVMELVGYNGIPAVRENIYTPEMTLYIPLKFWFNRNPGLALPLIALQYHEVKYHIEFESFKNLISREFSGGNLTPSIPKLGAASLFIDYVYLDTDERRKFANISHEYLIEQLQYAGNEGLSTVNNTISLEFNHPIKELIWIVQSLETTTGDITELGVGNNYTDKEGSSRLHVNNSENNPIKEGKIKLNGYDRISLRKGKYFNYIQPYQHHTNIPELGINVYSFGLNPEKHQPSGTLNMSRIDNASLHITLTEKALENNSNTAKIFATNYNILRIKSGLAGLAYSS